MYLNRRVIHAQIQTVHTAGDTHITLQNTQPTSAISFTQRATTLKIKIKNATRTPSKIGLTLCIQIHV